MPEKSKLYKFVKFSQETLDKGLKEFFKNGPLDKRYFGSRSVTNKHGVTWKHDSIEEFFADYNKDINGCHLVCTCGSGTSFSYQIVGEAYIDLSVKLVERSQIEAIFNIFDNAVPSSLLPMEFKKEALRKSLKIFIGHGTNPLWREINDYLRDKLKLQTDHFEIGATAGLTAQDILREKINNTSFAFLVFTGDNESADGSLYPRLNVVHEAGLFQGKLGSRKAIILLEEGCSDFSNIHGLQQIRFAKGNIKETFGEIWPLIEREFGED